MKEDRQTLLFTKAFTVLTNHIMQPRGLPGDQLWI